MASLALLDAHARRRVSTGNRWSARHLQLLRRVAAAAVPSDRLHRGELRGTRRHLRRSSSATNSGPAPLPRPRHRQQDDHVERPAGGGRWRGTGRFRRRRLREGVVLRPRHAASGLTSAGRSTTATRTPAGSRLSGAQDGVSLAQTRAELEVIASQIDRSSPDERRC